MRNNYLIKILRERGHSNPEAGVKNLEDMYDYSRPTNVSGGRDWDLEARLLLKRFVQVVERAGQGRWRVYEESISPLDREYGSYKVIPNTGTAYVYIKATVPEDQIPDDELERIAQEVRSAGYQLRGYGGSDSATWHLGEFKKKATITVTRASMR